MFNEPSDAPPEVEASNKEFITSEDIYLRLDDYEDFSVQEYLDKLKVIIIPILLLMVAHFR